MHMYSYDLIGYADDFVGNYHDTYLEIIGSWTLPSSSSSSSSTLTVSNIIRGGSLQVGQNIYNNKLSPNTMIIAENFEGTGTVIGGTISTIKITSVTQGSLSMNQELDAANNNVIVNEVLSGYEGVYVLSKAIASGSSSSGNDQSWHHHHHDYYHHCRYYH